MYMYSMHLGVGCVTVEPALTEKMYKMSLLGKHITILANTLHYNIGKYTCTCKPFPSLGQCLLLKRGGSLIQEDTVQYMHRNLPILNHHLLNG
jgi:hypothetical protein